MSRRSSKNWLVVTGLVVIVLAIVWLLTRSSAAPSPATGPVDASVPTAESAPEQGLDGAAIAPASERTSASVDEITESTPAPGDFALETLVHGVVLDTAGAPIARKRSAQVELIDDSGRRQNASVAGDGKYEFRALPMGAYWLTARAEGYRTVDERVELSAEQPRVRKDFQLASCVVIKIKVVTPEGQDVAIGMKGQGTAGSIVAVATRDHPGDRFFDVRGSLNNRYGVGNFWNHGTQFDGRFEGYSGIVVLRGELPVYVSLVHFHVVLATQRVEPGNDEVKFVLSQQALDANLASLRVRVLGADGKPIAGAEVGVTSSGSGNNKAGSADENGVALLAGFAPGSLDLRIHAVGHEWFYRRVVAEPATVTDLGDLVLDKVVEVHGRFVDDQGRGVSVSFAIGVLDPATGSVQMDSDQSGSSEENGEFTLFDLGRKQYVLRTLNHDAINNSGSEAITWVSGNVLVDTRAGPVSGLIVRLRPASLLVLRVRGETPDGLRFRVDDQDGQVLVESRFYGPGPRALKLPPGPYLARLLDERGRLLADRTVTLGSQTLEVELAR